MNALRWLLRERGPAITITTIEGPRHVTLGSGTIEDYGRKRRSMISGRTRIGQSRYARRSLFGFGA